jgi:hypothetical protein
LLALAEAIENEFAVITGDDLQLFLDRNSLEWGDLWRERISEALGEAPFFIAVVTRSTSAALNAGANCCHSPARPWAEALANCCFRSCSSTFKISLRIAAMKFSQ